VYIFVTAVSLEVSAFRVSPAAQVETAAFDAWLTDTWDGLRRFAFLVTGNREDAEDALQDALVGLCARWDTVAGRGDPGAYVRRSITNAHVSRWRRARWTIPSPDLEVLVSPAGAPDDAAVTVMTVAKLCSGLPVRQRAVIVMRFLDGWGYDEIAAVLGCSQAAVRSAARHALTAMRVELEEEK
jgi:RNA polymerase sigma factor (sigma-70 family)